MRRSRGKPLAFLILDIDHFKAVNDTYGHDIGDEVLREFASRISANVRGIDLACRYGGEEFVVVMPDTDVELRLHGRRAPAPERRDDAVSRSAARRTSSTSPSASASPVPSLATTPPRHCCTAPIRRFIAPNARAATASSPQLPDLPPPANTLEELLLLSGGAWGRFRDFASSNSPASGRARSRRCCLPTWARTCCASIARAAASPARPKSTCAAADTVAFDLKKPEAVEAALKLIDKADALIEGFRPGVMERLGLGPDVCLKRNPKLVYGRMTGWGQTGPLADRRRSRHQLHRADRRAARASALPGGKPVPPLNLVGDFGGGALYLAFGMVCALLEARNSGKGQVIDAAMTDGAASLMAVFYGMLASGIWKDERGVEPPRLRRALLRHL